MRRLLLTVAVAAGLGIARDARAQGFVVVVNAQNPVSAATAAQVSAVFLKKDRNLAGHAVVPVDQTPGSAARQSFTKAVHGRAVTAVQSFWQQQIFSGANTPPPEKEGDAEVLAFVRGNPSAVGYVSAGAALGPGVKALTLNP